MTKSIPWGSCWVFIIICLAISGVAGGVTSAHIASWYEHLNQPAFRPPNWLFAPVWTVLYILIGIAGGYVWRARNNSPKLWWVYLLQLVFNFAWSFIFFGEQMIGLALVDIILLWLTILLTLCYSYQSARVAFYCFIPYFLWVSFATTLNFSLWLLN